MPGSQRHQNIQPHLRLFLEAIRSSKYLFGLNSIGIHLQNLLYLHCRQLRIVSEQISRIPEGDLQVTFVGSIGHGHLCIIHDYSLRGSNLELSA